MNSFTPVASDGYFDIRERVYGWIKPENTLVGFIIRPEYTMDTQPKSGRLGLTSYQKQPTNNAGVSPKKGIECSHDKTNIRILLLGLILFNRELR